VTAVLTQDGPGEVLERTDEILLWQHRFDLHVVVVDSDAATAAMDTRIHAAIADITAALQADLTCGGWACTGGLEIDGAVPVDDPTGRLSGATLPIAVTYSTQAASAYTKGLE